MDVNENNNTAFDEAGFKAFFQSHPNDATIAEDLPPADNAGDSGADNPDNNGVGDANTEDPGNNAIDNGSGNDDAAQNSAQSDTSTQRSNDKQAQAFAQMRIANQKQQQLINQIAQVVGIADTKDHNAVIQALQNLAIKAQSQKQGIPEEILTKLNRLEGMEQEYQKQQAYLAAGRGFQNIKDQFKLDDTALENFAQELIADGLNPYEQMIDLVGEYRNRHFDELIEQAVQRGIAQEAQRAAKAGAQGSTPPDTTGGRAESEPPKINTVADLNKWLEENK
jgi:hypothetical protein